MLKVQQNAFTNNGNYNSKFSFKIEKESIEKNHTEIYIKKNWFQL